MACCFDFAEPGFGGSLIGTSSSSSSIAVWQLFRENIFFGKRMSDKRLGNEKADVDAGMVDVVFVTIEELSNFSGTCNETDFLSGSLPPLPLLALLLLLAWLWWWWCDLLRWKRPVRRWKNVGFGGLRLLFAAELDLFNNYKQNKFFLK